MTKLTDSYVNGWNKDWGPIVDTIMQGTGLTRIEALLFLCTMRMEALVQIFHNPELAELQRIQGDIMRAQHKDLIEDKDWER